MHINLPRSKHFSSLPIIKCTVYSQTSLHDMKLFGCVVQKLLYTRGRFDFRSMKKVIYYAETSQHVYSKV